MTRTLSLLLTVVALLLHNGAEATDAPARIGAIDDCIDVAARAFAIDPLPLRILRRTEAGQVGTVAHNDDRSVDLGPMQINSVHLPEFARFGLGYADLRDNRGCANVLAAAYLLKRHLIAERGDVAMAIADYHSRDPRHALRYLGLVQQAIAAERRELAQRATAVPGDTSRP